MAQDFSECAARTRENILARAFVPAGYYSKKRFFLRKVKQTASSRQGVDHQHGNRHRTNATGNRCYGTCNLCCFCKVHIANQASLAFTQIRSRDSVDADIDNGRARFDPIALDHLRPTDRRDDDVCGTHDVPAGLWCGCERS